MGPHLYFIGIAILIVAFVVGRSGSGNSLRARDVSGNTMVGNASGSIYQGAMPPPATPPRQAANASPDRIAWAIGIIGVLVACMQLAHDLLK